MTGIVIPIGQTSKKPPIKPVTSKFSVYFRLPEHAAMVVNAKCFQIINGMTYFFAIESKEVGRLLAQYLTIPESVAAFRTSDISHILRDTEVVGSVRVNDLIQMDLIMAGAGIVQEPEELEPETVG